ncbi:MAG: hypothetical protein HYV78_01865 [Candidatus Wildermuthbacteria bacterium]|nr:hypothetical protein [Candidatus Wildermuthbacteria bacterium]
MRFLFLFAGVAVLMSVAARFLPHPANFTPIGALALFAGAHLSQKSRWWLAVPLGAMLVSDLFIGFYDWRIMAVVYASFLLYGLFGIISAKQNTSAAVIGASFAGSVMFYLATNAAVWAFSPMYQKTLSDLLLSYTLAIPFFKTMVLGDLLYTGVFFGAYEFCREVLARRFAVRQAA